MTTISTSFTAVGTSTSQLTVFAGYQATYTVTGTFVATLVLETTVNNGQTWTDVVTLTGTQAATTLYVPGTYRWKCTAFTSGTAVAAIADVAHNIAPPLVNSAGDTVFVATETGMTTLAIVATSAAFSGTVALNAGGSIAGGTNIALSATTGTKIGTATSQKLGFWNVTPVIQPAGAAQAAPAAYVTGGFGLDSDVNMQALYDLVVAMRTALVSCGILKGGA